MYVSLRISKIISAARQTLALGSVVFGLLVVSSLFTGDEWTLRHPQYWNILLVCALVWSGLGTLWIGSSRNHPPKRLIFQIVPHLAKLGLMYVVVGYLLVGLAGEWQALSDPILWNTIAHYFFGGVGLFTLFSWGCIGHHLDFREEYPELFGDDSVP